MMDRRQGSSYRRKTRAARRFAQMVNWSGAHPIPEKTRSRDDENHETESICLCGAAVLGIWGNSTQEAVYPAYYVDADGQELDGANRYSVRFAPGQLPPVNAFWSVTMYEMPASLLIANPLNRYLLNSPMLPQFTREADGGITFYIQHGSPGTDKEANWLPAPKGPFSLILRLYWPKTEAIEGEWTEPPIQRM